MSSTMALWPEATTEQADWNESTLFPRAFSPKTWVMVPAGSPPFMSVSTA